MIMCIYIPSIPPLLYRWIFFALPPVIAHLLHQALWEGLRGLPVHLGMNWTCGEYYEILWDIMAYYGIIMGIMYKIVLLLWDYHGNIMGIMDYYGILWAMDKTGIKLGYYGILWKIMNSGYNWDILDYHGNIMGIWIIMAITTGI